MIAWKRTGNNEYPENGQECLIYFFHTGYCTSTYSYDENAEYTKHMFHDKGGFLGDEDVLWIPTDVIKALQMSEEEIKKELGLPHDYLDKFEPAHKAWLRRNNKNFLVKAFENIINNILRFFAAIEWLFRWPSANFIYYDYNKQLDELLLAFMSDKIDAVKTTGSDDLTHRLVSGKYLLYSRPSKGEYYFYQKEDKKHVSLENLLMSICDQDRIIRYEYDRPSFYAINKLLRVCMKERNIELKKEKQEERDKLYIEGELIKNKFKNRFDE
jgi:hypothetical protein